MAIDPNFNKFNYDDYVLFPEDGNRHEIIEGDHFMNPAPNSYHQVISGRIYSQLAKLIEKPKKGFVFYAPIDVLLDEFNIVQPDLLVILNERKSIITKKNIQGAPNLVVEIVSPGNPKHDRQLKKKLYEKHQIPEYWIVDPEAESIEAFWLMDNQYQLRDISGNVIPIQIIPGSTIDVTGLFEFDF